MKTKTNILLPLILSIRQASNPRRPRHTAARNKRTKKMIFYVDWKSQSEDRQRKKKSDRRRKEEALNMRREGSGEKAQGNKRRTYASVGGLK
jgi:hypothetical protein